MAEVATKISARIDHYLDRLFGDWEDIPVLAEEWPTLNQYDRLDFILEWPITTSYMGELRRYAEEGLLTAEQQARYQELLSLAERHRPTLERLLAE